MHLRAKRQRRAAVRRARVARGRAALDHGLDHTPNVRRTVLKTRRASAVLLLPAFLWVFTQLVMSGFILQPAAAADSGLTQVVICTGSELITLTLDANGQPVNGHPAQKTSCPWCAQFGGVAPVPQPDLTLVAAPCSQAHRLSVPKAQQTNARFSHTPYGSRAPPFSTSL